MSRSELILIGAGGHAESCIDVIEQHGQFNIAGLIGRKEEVGAERYGYRVIAADDALAQVSKDYHYALIVVGQIQSPDLRMRLFEQAQALGLELPVIISPRAYVSRRATVGSGTVVMHGAIINAGACIGANCIINSCALIEHGVSVGDHCHVSTGAILNGEVNVGVGSFVGSGSSIKEGVSLGQRCLVGMATCVRHDQVDGARVIG